ncbi:MAG TPA: hypothetical protein DD381_14195 [Lentisphaeria bacterium]|nr:MAG: hypothetical protein A2X47_01070 [Lentisphaerae bacterium GWF2_38_69]HBM17475.1 hypothetical protein [Lentisphaeria bacterium]
MAKNNKKLFNSVDVISKELDAVDNFVLKYWKKYVYIAIGVIVVVAAVTIFIRVFEHNSTSAAREISGALSLEQLQTAVSKNPTNVLTPYAELEMVPKLLEKKDIDGAKKVCNKVISSRQDPYALAQAKVDLGYIAEIQGNNDEAIKIFTQLASDPESTESVKAESFYNAGRIYLAMGKKTQAIEVLKKCSAISDSSSMGWQEFANNLMNAAN